MTLRMATLDDLPKIAAMGLRFIQAHYSQHLAQTPEQIDRIVTKLIEEATASVWVSEVEGDVVGMLGAFTYDHPISAERMAVEMFWWVDPEHRGAQVPWLDTLETWAREQGATRIQMIAPNDKVGRYYQHRGYTAVETSFQRSL